LDDYWLGVFTLQSIKSRIETEVLQEKPNPGTKFLLYSPLNQGLKPPPPTMVV